MVYRNNKARFFRNQDSDLYLPEHYRKPRKRRLGPNASITWVTPGATSFIDDAAHNTRTITLAVTAGNLVVVTAGFAIGGGTTANQASNATCTDNLSTPTGYQLQIQTYDNADGGVLTTFWGIPTVTGTATITINAGTGVNPAVWRLSAQQYNSSAGWPSTPVDAMKSYVGAATTAANNIQMGPRITANNGDLIYCALFDEFNNVGGFTAGTGALTFTIRGAVGDGSHDFAIQDAIQTAAGSTTATATIGSSTPGVYSHMIAFSPNAGSGGTGGNPSIYAGFENSTNGTLVTTAILAGGTVGETGISSNSCFWNPSYTATSLKVATVAEHQLLSPVIISGTSFNDASGTRGIQYDTSVSDTDHNPLWVDHISCSFAIGHWLFLTKLLSDTSQQSFSAIGNAGGTEGINIACHSGNLYLETTPTSISSGFAYSLNTWYWVSLVMNAYAGGTHSLSIYDATGNLLSTQTHAASSTHLPGLSFSLGTIGDGTSATQTFMYWDDLVVDAERGTPIPPIFVSNQDVISIVGRLGLGLR